MKAVCLLSGGMDSTTLAYTAKDMGYDILALHVNYGQRTEKKELECAKKIADRLGALEFIEINLDYFTKFGASSLTDFSIPVEKGALGRVEQPNTYVPFRNGNLIAIAASFCEAKGGDAVFIGVQSGDHTGYPDCTPEFISAMQNVINIGTQTEKKIQLLTPFVRMNKTEILQEGLRLHVPYEDTWSCYSENEESCGVCSSCLSRLKAFADLGMEDPIAYKKKE
ncbi:MAG TPA: 7-cyano-7-deazaguanine synthase QueC [Methanocorpusculum sp.]|nr:7-cyano-7-deazaguanine synthase QueC [Candidatus Methanocorpusculum equi]MCQ2357540.1 7-cyano-7-deazaguanine synthase QueC [Methanocorpusculum sp.]HJJ44217.1 7-cyano-7-deazaguanine synthase QueC [Methanocorpusculum sp.]HJJ57980.1 7-cyano-7-deazaguanine synthase QueC [Methanocorpusculum sp.]HJJ59870.1 7-cyano-7-deazaguanine synthase QueC [Methanocorpusculum sp.]